MAQLYLPTLLFSFLCVLGDLNFVWSLVHDPLCTGEILCFCGELLHVLFNTKGPCRSLWERKGSGCPFGVHHSGAALQTASSCDSLSQEPFSP